MMIIRNAIAVALTALAVASLPASAQDAGNEYGPPSYAGDSQGAPPAYGTEYANAPECDPANYAPGQVMPPACMQQAYCDQYGCPDDFYDMPIWYGPVFYDNAWFGGPVYYRVRNRCRQYWIHGGWRYDAWTGPHPSWWNAARYHTGPALGRNYHRIGAAPNATDSVRVWRGTQASVYHDGGNGQDYSRALANREAPSQASAPATGHVNFQAQHVAQQSSPRTHYSGSHNFARAINQSSRGGIGSHHGH